MILNLSRCGHTGHIINPAWTCPKLLGTGGHPVRPVRSSALRSNVGCNSLGTNKTSLVPSRVGHDSENSPAYGGITGDAPVISAGGSQCRTRFCKWSTGWPSMSQVRCGWLRISMMKIDFSSIQLVFLWLPMFTWTRLGNLWKLRCCKRWDQIQPCRARFVKRIFIYLSLQWFVFICLWQHSKFAAISTYSPPVPSNSVFVAHPGDWGLRAQITAIMGEVGVTYLILSPCLCVCSRNNRISICWSVKYTRWMCLNHPPNCWQLITMKWSGYVIYW